MNVFSRQGSDPHVNCPGEPLPPPGDKPRRPGLAATLRAAPVWQLYVLVGLASLLSSAGFGALIPRHLPWVHDEFAYLLAGQTFSEFRLTNPAHPLWQFFETHHILVQPTYTAKYPPGHGLVLALGFWLGNPIYGVWIEGALLSMSVLWMLRSFLPMRWALLGAAIAIVQFGCTYYWAQTFWGGALAATGGALVFGGAARIWRRSPSARDAALLGAGVVILMLTRPFEGLLASLVPAAAVIARWLRGGVFAATVLRTIIAPCAVVIAGGVAFLCYHNYRVTGSPWRLPYFEYDRQYSGAPYFIWQERKPDPVFANRALETYYHSYVIPLSRFYDSALRTLGQRLSYLVTSFIGWPLAIMGIVGCALRPSRWIGMAFASLAACSLALVVSYWFSSHYQAVVAAVYVFVVIAGTRIVLVKFPATRRLFPLVALLLLAVQASLAAFDDSTERRGALFDKPPPRQLLADALLTKEGKHIVFVRMQEPYYLHHGWVFNEADLDKSRILWAWDRGPQENARLRTHYPDRKAVLVIISDKKFSVGALPPIQP